MHLALAGGVGGARLAYGLSRALGGGDLSVVVNTGDDFRHLGLAICPDLDTVMYTLAELDDVDRGWGRSDESWRFMASLESLGGPGWFRLGDNDLATHVMRTHRLAQGASLTAVTEALCGALGISTRVLPMTDDPVATVLQTVEGEMAFQDYFVGRRCEPVVIAFEYQGADAASPHPELLRRLADPATESIVICPSNPWLSIAPILALPGVAQVLRATSAPVIVVSPIVGGRAVKGPAGKLMAELKLEVSALGIARVYAGLADGIVIDAVDAHLRWAIEALGLKVMVTDSMMPDRNARIRVAEAVLAEAWT